MTDYASAVPLSGSKNVAMTAKDGVLQLWIDLNKDFGESSSGKSVVIASSCGNKPLGASNAFLGLNLFVKSLDARDLSSKGIDSLLTSSQFHDCGEGCQWRIEKVNVNKIKDIMSKKECDKTEVKHEKEEGEVEESINGHAILCIRIDFANVKGRTASSGKSILLATSGGIKPVGNTKIMCGLNCYRALTTTLDYNKLISTTTNKNDNIESNESNENELSNVNTMVKVGECIKAPSGFVLHYTRTDDVKITLTLPSHFHEENVKQGRKSEAEKAGVYMRNIILTDNINVNLFVNPIKPKRKRSADADEDKDDVEKMKSSDAGVNASNASKKENNIDKNKENSQNSCNNGGFVDSAKTKVRNVTASCEKATNGKDVILTLHFNPTIEFGRSTSGKSIIVASTGGFQCVTSADGEAQCVVSLNAYKPAEQLSTNAINDAVRKALASVSTNELHTVSFKSILEKVETALQLNAKHEQIIKERVKEAVRATLKETTENTSV